MASHDSSVRVRGPRRRGVLAGRRPAGLVLVTAVLCHLVAMRVTPLAAAEYTWTGGSGTWNTTAARWIGPGPQWVNSATNSAVFGGANSSVVVLDPFGNNIVAGGVTFTASNVTISATSARRLALESFSFSVQPFIAVDADRATLAATIASSNGLLKTGDGELLLSGSNAISGIVRPVEGRLTLRNVNALAGSQLDMNLADGGEVGFALPGAQIYSIGSVTGSRDVRLGGNTLLLSGGDYAGMFTDGQIRLRQGTFTVRNPDALAFATLDMNSLDAGGITTAASGTVALGGLRGSRNLSLTNNTTTLLVGGNDQSTTYSGTLAMSRLVKTGTGTLVLAGSAAYAGPVRIDAGLLGLGHVNSLANATVDMSADDAGALAFLVPGRQTYQIGGLAGSRNIEFADNTLAIGGGTFAGVLSGDGGSLWKVGTGTLDLRAPGAFTGTTRVSGGILRLTDRQALAGSVLDMNAADVGSLQVATSGTQPYSIGGLKGARNLDLRSPSPVVLAIGGNDQSTTYSGTVFAAGFVKTGTGTLTLASGSAIGLTTGNVLRINAGVLGLGHVNSLANATVDMSADDAGALALSLIHI